MIARRIASWICATSLLLTSCVPNNDGYNDDSIPPIELDLLWIQLADHTGTVDRDNYYTSVEKAVLSPDGKLAASASKLGCDLMVWDVEKQLVIWDTVLTTFVMSVEFLDNGQKLISAGHDSTIRVWNTSTGELLQEKKLEHGIECLELNHDKSIMATGDKGGIITLLTTSTLEWFAQASHGPDRDAGTHEYYNSDVISLSFSPDGNWLASGSINTEVCVWDVPGLKTKKRLRGHQSTIKAVAFTPCGRYIISAVSSVDERSDGDNSLGGWDWQENKLVFQVNFPFGLETLGIHPSGDYLFVGSKEGKNYEDPMGGMGNIMVFSLPENPSAIPPQLLLKKRAFRQEHFDFTSDGKTVLSSHDDGTIRLWNIQIGQKEDLNP